MDKACQNPVRDHGQYDIAQQSLLKGKESDMSNRGDDNVPASQCVDSLIDLYEAWSKPEEADKRRARLPQTDAAGE